MNLEDYKRLLEVLQKHIQFQRAYLERTNFFEQDHEHTTKLNPQIKTDYLHGLLDLSEYQKTEKKLIEKIKSLEEIKRLEEECKKSPLPDVKWSDLNKTETFLNNSICSSHAVIEEVENE